MNRMRHGRLTVDLPAGWVDRSTLLFVGAPPPLPTANPTRAAQPSVTVHFARTKGEDPRTEARAILDDELAGLRAMSVAVEPLGVEDFEAPAGKGALMKLRLTLDGLTLQQLQVVVITGQVAIRAAASTGESGDVESLKSVLSSLSMEPS